MLSYTVIHVGVSFCLCGYGSNFLIDVWYLLCYMYVVGGGEVPVMLRGVCAACCVHGAA